MTFGGSVLMFLAILLFEKQGYALVLDPGCLPQERNMSINGINAVRAPWMAYLINKDNEFVCGGSLVSSHLVLTAKHCVESIRIVRLGEYDTSTEKDGQTIDVRIIKIFSAPRPHDAALIKLAQKVAYSETIKPICILRPELFNRLPAVDQFTLTGWGRTSRINATPATVLQQIFVNRIDSTVCNSTIGEFCCYNPDQNTCGGDSGSPLVAYVQYNPTTTIAAQYGVLAHNSELCFDHSYYVDVNKLAFYILIANWL